MTLLHMVNKIGQVVSYRKHKQGDTSSIQSSIGADDTSSGSSSDLHDNYFPQSTEPRIVVTSVNIVGKGNSKLIDEKGSKVRTKPLGYLKVKAQADEHVAISSLKRQLGRHYREDGPPLGIDFDPLPPGAFESPVRVAVEVSKALRNPADVDGRLAAKANEQKKRKKTETSSTAPKVTPNPLQDSSSKHVTPPPDPKDKGPSIVEDSLDRSPKRVQRGPLISQLDHFAVPASTASLKMGQDLAAKMLCPGDAAMFSKYSVQMFDQVFGHLYQPRARRLRRPYSPLPGKRSWMLRRKPRKLMIG